jgi:hypothetical protein
MKKFSRVSSEWTNEVFSDEPFVINVLVVADGKVTFNPNPEGFTLTIFRDILRQQTLPWEEIRVTTAHRKPPDDITGADKPGFKFDQVENDGSPVFSIEKFDELWLFGDEGEGEGLAISESEVSVITEFMKQGGGVFATGDHEDLGSAMCGNIPRVRRMRRWHFKRDLTKGEVPAPSRNESTRIDTLREGIDPGFQGDPEEKDAIPQEIRPKFFVNETMTAAEPHELLAMNKFSITILPDHMHEGECVNPAEIKKKASADEFPPRSDGEPVMPQVVAVASSAGGALVPSERIFPVDPRCYIVISAYDGHLVDLGRVVVDASFHHFVNFNLNGFTGKNEFEIFAQYYRNTLHYLLPPKKQQTYFLHLLRALRFSPPLQEDLDGLTADNWEHVVYAGTATKKVISNDFSPAYARRCAVAMISNVKPNLRTYLQDMIDLWQEKNRVEFGLFFLNSDAILIVLLGQAILGLASNLPQRDYEVSRALKGLKERRVELQDLVTESVARGATQLQEEIGKLGRHLDQISKI